MATKTRKTSRRRHVSARGPRRAAWRKPDPAQVRVAQAAEKLMEDEDDFVDGRSSAGLRMRAEEDAQAQGPVAESFTER